MTDTQGKIKEDLMLSPTWTKQKSKTNVASLKSLETKPRLLFLMNTPTSSNTDLVLNSHSRKKAAFMTKFPVSLQGNFKSTLTLSTYNMQLTSPQYTQLNFREITKKIAEIACSWTISTTKPFPFFNNGNVISIMWPLPILQIQEGTTPVDLLLPNQKSRTRESQEGERKKNLQQRMVKPRQKCKKYSHKRQFNTSLTQQQHCKNNEGWTNKVLSLSSP